MTGPTYKEDSDSCLPPLLVKLSTSCVGHIGAVAFYVAYTVSSFGYILSDGALSLSFGEVLSSFSINL